MPQVEVFCSSSCSQLEVGGWRVREFIKPITRRGAFKGELESEIDELWVIIYDWYFWTAVDHCWIKWFGFYHCLRYFKILHWTVQFEPYDCGLPVVIFCFCIFVFLYLILTSSWPWLNHVSLIMTHYCGSINLHQQSVCILNWIWTWMTSWYQRQIIWPRNLIRENWSLVNMLRTVLRIEQINWIDSTRIL